MQFHSFLSGRGFRWRFLRVPGSSGTWRDFREAAASFSSFPHPGSPFVLSIFFSTWWSPVSGARGDDERRQRLFRLISLLLRFENCGPLFYQPRVHSLGRQRAARAARCDCARHVVSTPVFLGRGGGCQGTSCLLSLLPFRLLPLVLPRLPVAVRRRRDWRRGGRNYRREWRTAAINPRRQVFRG